MEKKIREGYRAAHGRVTREEKNREGNVLQQICGTCAGASLFGGCCGHGGGGGLDGRGAAGWWWAVLVLLQVRGGAGGVPAQSRRALVCRRA